MNEVIRLKCDFAEAYVARGVIYYDLEQPHRAIEDFDEAIRLKRDFAKAYELRGMSYAYLGKHEKAQLDFNEAIRLKPEYEGAYYSYACLFSLQKDAILACSLLEQAIGRGYKDWNHLKADKDFDNIRNEKCFIDILNKYAR